MPRPTGWTIEVGLAPALAAQSRRWSTKKRQAFHELAGAAAYQAIDAIQSGRLFKRRRKVWIDGSWIRYFLRLDVLDKRTVLVTVSHYYFIGPDDPVPPNDGGHRGLPPLDLLLSVSGRGKRYSIDLIRGVLPRPSNGGQIVSSIDEPKSRRGKLRLLDLLPWRREPDGLPSEAMLDAVAASGMITYVSRPYLSRPSVHLSGASPQLARAQIHEIAGRSHWMSKLAAVLRRGRKSAEKTEAIAFRAPQANVSECVLSEKHFRNSHTSTEAHYSYRMIARRRIHMANSPVRPGGLR